MSEEPMKEWEGPQTGPGAAEGTPAPLTSSAEVERQRRRRAMAPFLLLVVTQPLLLVVVLVPAWWAALPVLSIWGIVGWRNRWVWAPLTGFLLGFGFWVFELLLLPTEPRIRLTDVIAAGEGLSPTTAFLIGPLLFGLLAAMAALTLAGALRVWDDLRRAPPASAPPRLEPEPTST